MTSIADSSAVREDRVLSQHQAALTLLQGRLSDPAIKELAWLDLACGRGQIIAYLEDQFSEAKRALIRFHGYDIDQVYARETRRIASQLKFQQQTLDVGELANFDRILPAAARFDFISLTNTVHELSPRSLAELLLKAISRLSPTGTLFVYDMEQVSPPELGAVPWSRDEIRIILHDLLRRIAPPGYEPEVSRWQHKTRAGWNFLVDRVHVKLDDAAFVEAEPAALSGASKVIAALMQSRLSACKTALSTLTDNPPETAEEEVDKTNLLHELWALTRALEATT